MNTTTITIGPLLAAVLITLALLGLLAQGLQPHGWLRAAIHARRHKHTTPHTRRPNTQTRRPPPPAETATQPPAVSATQQIYDICELVAARWHVPLEQLLGDSRAEPAVTARHIAMRLARETTSLSYPQIARHFGRDHTTVLHAIRRVETHALTDLHDELQAKWADTTTPTNQPPRQTQPPASA